MVYPNMEAEASENPLLSTIKGGRHGMFISLEAVSNVFSVTSALATGGCAVYVLLLQSILRSKCCQI